MSKENENKYKYVLVIGGSGGLGEAICNQLKNLDLKPLIGWHKNESKAIEIAKKSSGFPLKIDLLNPVDSYFRIESLKFSKNIVGVIHSCSQQLSLEKFSNINESELRKRLEIDIFGTWYLINMINKKILKPMRKGFIVFVLSSSMGNFEKAAMSSIAGYVIGKYALAGISATLGADNKWLKVLTISPGFIDTSMLNAFDSRFVDQLRANNSVSTPKEIANQIIALLKTNI